MSAFENYSLILHLMDSLYNKDSWCGETHIQKSMYVYETVFSVKTEFNYVLYKHGPYSFNLHDTLNDLMAYQLVEAEQRPPYGPRLKVTDQGRSFMQQHGSVDPKRLDAVTTALRHESVQSLEKLATALMIFVKDPTEHAENRAQLLHQLKPHVPLEDARIATCRMDVMWKQLKAA